MERIAKLGPSGEALVVHGVVQKRVPRFGRPFTVGDRHNALAID